VSKPGSATEERKDVTLRAGETATMKVKLLVGPEKTEVTVYGTNQGRACGRADRPPAGQPDDPTRRRSSAQNSPRCRSSNLRSARGKGPVTVRQTRRTSSRPQAAAAPPVHAGWREQRRGVGPSDHAGHGPVAPFQEVAVLSMRFPPSSAGHRARDEHRETKSGTNAVHGEGLYLARPGGWQADTFSTKGFCRASASACVVPATLTGDHPGRRA